MKEKKVLEDNNRRNFLRNSLAAIAGLSAGFSILQKEVLAGTAQVKKMSVQPRAIMIPRNLQYTIKAPNYRVFKPDSQKKLVRSVSPLLNQMVQEAGIKMNSAQISKLQSAFESRGMINVRGPGKAADVTIKVGGSLSVSW